MAKFAPRQRKHKARQRQVQDAPQDDSNATELLPVSRTEKKERCLRLREGLRAQNPTSKASSKKKKRLNKYIDSKLKREENSELIRKLSSQKTDTSLLRSFKKLGRGNDTSREALSRALQQTRAGIDQGTNKQALFKRRLEPGTSDEELDEIPKSNVSDQELPRKPRREDSRDQRPAAAFTFGAGLKRPLDLDETGNPIIQTRKRLKTRPKASLETQNEGSDWGGFSSDGEEQNSDQGSTADQEVSQSSESDAESLLSSDDQQSGQGSIISDESASASSGKAENLAKRSLAFKDWATQQRNQAIGFTPSKIIPSVNLDELKSHQDNHSGKQEPCPALSAHIKEALDLKPRDIMHTAFHVSVNRTPEIEDTRSKLPVVAEEQMIMETVRKNDCTIVCGDTGSGKTTQVPQFLFEAGYGSSDSPCPGMIGVTQPRRVAAVSMAKRVAHELGNLYEKVAYQVRFDSSVGSKTAVKFMTDGVLLREISQDFLLSKYSVIVIDEVHERSVNTDILIGMLSRIVQTRARLVIESSKNRPLKLIVMSATLRVADFTHNPALFREGPPPVVQVEGRQYDVTVHFARKTRRDYVEEAFEKVRRGHKKLPPGSMLVFLTGQNEIDYVSKRLRESFPSTSKAEAPPSMMRVSATEASIESEDIELGRHRNDRESSSESDVSFHGVDNDGGSDREDDEFDVGDHEPAQNRKIHVLPLFSQLPTDQQMRVFETPPQGSRLIVLATNVAETSLTIPGIRYVFDCGRSKEKKYDPTTGVQSFAVDWISKANASQRAGRAGRMGPGHCYRLYSSAIYERDFAQHPIPEILRASVEGVVLQLKSMGIPNIGKFPFPTSPDLQSLLNAERLLEHLGAITVGKVTPLGKELSAYPLSPRLSRILVTAPEHDCFNLAVALVSGLAVPEIFVSEAQLGRIEPDLALTQGTSGQEVAVREKRRRDYCSFHGHVSRLDRHSDAIKLLTTLCEFTQQQKSSDTFRVHTRIKALQEALQLRRQLNRIIATHRPGALNANADAKLSLPQPTEIKVLRQLVAAGFIDQIAQRADLSPSPPPKSRRPSRTIDVPYITLFKSQIGRTDKDQPDSNYVYIHASSVLAHISIASLPQFLVYSHLSRAAPSSVGIDTGEVQVKQPRIRLHPLTPVSAEQIISIARQTPLLGEGKPVDKIKTLERSAKGEERRVCWIVPFLKGEAGGIEWPLPPARRVTQKRLPSKSWVNDREL